MLFAHIAHDGFIEFIPGDLDGIRQHRPAQGQDGHVAGAAADIQDHIAPGLGNVDARADSRRDGLLDQVGMAGAGFFRGVDDGTLFHLGDAAGHAYHHPGLKEDAPAHHLAQEMVEQALGNIVIGNDPVPQRPHSQNIARGTAQHPPGFLADGQDLAGDLLHRHHGRLPQHNALAPDIYQYAGGSQVDPYIVELKQSHRFDNPPTAPIEASLAILLVTCT